MGAVDNDFATVSYDSNGVSRWETRHDSNSSDFACDMGLDASGNVYVTGSSNSETGSDYVTMRYNTSGTLQWVSHYTSEESGWAEVCAMAVDEAGNCFVLGSREIQFGSYIGFEYATVAYGPDGNQQWVAGYGGGLFCDPADIALCGSDGILAVGKVDGEALEGMLTNFGTVLYDYSGVEQWSSEYNGTADWYDAASAVAVDASGNSYVTGYTGADETGPDFTTVRYDSSGNQIWVMNYGGPSDWDDAATAITVDGSGNVYVTGRSFDPGTGYDFATIMYEQNTGIEGGDASGGFTLRTSPNPATSWVSISVILADPSVCSVLVYGLDGRVVRSLHEGCLPSGGSTLHLDAASLPAGVYLIRADAGRHTETLRVLIMR